MSDPIFMESRRADTDPAGKCDTRLEAMLPAELHDQITTLASLAGLPRSEYVRIVLDQHANGALAYARRRMGTARP